MTSTGPSRHWLEAKYLLRWLLVATKGLSDESRERVNQEITSHFHDALDEGILAGLPEDLAAEQSVESLGNPKAARRAFRRTYLTRYQARIARDLVEPRKRIWALRVYLVLAAAGLLAFFPRVSLREPFFTRVGVVVLMATAVLLLATAVPRLYRRGRQRTAVALAAGSESALWLSWLFLVGSPNRSDVRLWILAAAIFLAANYVPLVSKYERRSAAE